MEEFDIVVVGAGWYGLAAARTYLELHPKAEMLVIDSASSVGGVWSRQRLYPGLKSNNMLGTYEYSDFPMDTTSYGVDKWEHIPGQVLHQYLTNFAERFGVYKRIRFNTRVETAEEDSENNWILGVSNAATGAKNQLKAKKLIIATGLTSDAFVPTFTGQEQFGSPIFHTKNFLDHTDTFKTARSAAILGGAKSAWDAAYAYATAGVPVDMIIRKSGRGPVWMAPPYVTPLRRWLEKLVHSRFLTWFSPCIWGEEDGYVGVRSFLHGTWLGRKIVETFWNILGNDVITINGFDKHVEMKKLKPWNDAFWIGSGLSILNYPTDFFELVRNGSIRVHVADITHLSEKVIHLSTGEKVKADVLVCATGWKPSPPIGFLPQGSLSKLGLPHYSSFPNTLARKADAVILDKFPRLKDQPKIERLERTGGSVEASNQPFRLYRFMVPPAFIHKRNIAFAGMITTITTSTCAQAQALWISAYFDEKLDRELSEHDAEWEATLHSQFGKWRYPCGYGARLPDFVFDAVPYIDMLMKDVGLKSRRKRGLLADAFQPYGPEDYKELPSEWVQAHA